MDALCLRAAMMAAIVLSLGANYRTPNFLVTAPSPPLAREIGDAAERYRHDLAIEWLGKPLPRWPQPCPITAQVNARLGAGGATSFMFDTQSAQFRRPVQNQSGPEAPVAILGGPPHGWQMSIQGSRERILDSVLPHEVTHTIFATYFGRPLPRWADEGACTTVEHASERGKQERLLRQFLTTGRGIAFNRMFAMTEYPPDILPLYSQGFSLARYLIAQGGQRKFVRYVGRGMASGNWTATTREFYGFQNISELQLAWVDWVRQGYPPVQRRGEPAPQEPEGEAPLLAAAENPRRSGRSGHEDAVAPSTVGDRLAPVPFAGPGVESPHRSRAGDRSRQVSVSAGDRPESGLLASAATEAPVSWYAQQRHRRDGENVRPQATQKPTSQPDASANATAPSQSVPVASVATGSEPPPRRAVSRPDREASVRDILIEWGQPARMFTPALQRGSQ